MTKKGQGKTLRKAVPKQVYASNPQARRRIVAMLVENPDLSAEAIAQELNMSVERVRSYMTRALKDEVEHMRKQALNPSVEEIDRAMMKQAQLGNVQAARLVYMRMAQKGEGSAIPTLEELEAELRSLKALERKTKGGTKDDTSLGDAIAMADDARG